MSEKPVKIVKKIDIEPILQQLIDSTQTTWTHGYPGDFTVWARKMSATILTSVVALRTIAAASGDE